VRALVLLAIAMFVFGCSQPGEAPSSDRPEKDAREKVTEEAAVITPTPEPTAVEETTYVASESATAAPSSASASPNAAFNCRILAYVAEENMSEAEAADFSEEIANRMVEDMDAGGHKDMGDIMDDMGVPAYKEECGGEE
jgi:hypothetical protein